MNYYTCFYKHRDKSNNIESAVKFDEDYDGGNYAED